MVATFRYDNWPSAFVTITMFIAIYRMQATIVAYRSLVEILHYTAFASDSIENKPTAIASVIDSVSISV